MLVHQNSIHEVMESELIIKILASKVNIGWQRVHLNNFKWTNVFFPTKIGNYTNTYHLKVMSQKTLATIKIKHGYHFLLCVCPAAFVQVQVWVIEKSMEAVCNKLAVWLLHQSQRLLNPCALQPLTLPSVVRADRHGGSPPYLIKVTFNPARGHLLFSSLMAAVGNGECVDGAAHTLLGKAVQRALRTDVSSCPERTARHTRN